MGFPFAYASRLQELWLPPASRIAAHRSNTVKKRADVLEQCKPMSNSSFKIKINLVWSGLVWCSNYVHSARLGRINININIDITDP